MPLSDTRGLGGAEPGPAAVLPAPAPPATPPALHESPTLPAGQETHPASPPSADTAPAPGYKPVPLPEPHTPWSQSTPGQAWSATPVLAAGVLACPAASGALLAPCADD